MNTRTLYIVLGIALLVWLVLWQPWRAASPLSTTSGSTQHMPDFIAENLVSKIFSAEGTLIHRIEAERMAHFNLSQRTELTAPKYSAFLEESSENFGNLWEVTSETGILYNDEQLTLENKVLIQNISGVGYFEKVETDFLTIDLTTQSMYSERPVILTGPQFTVKGIGFKLNIETQQLELDQHVETVFYPLNP